MWTVKEINIHDTSPKLEIHTIKISNVFEQSHHLMENQSDMKCCDHFQMAQHTQRKNSPN
ncbi:CLUMA_CG014840, isoform A [Clunio marinus]|uniref:CLUMA_CG014840, isoform A n=1 Tax=Clunio marinus TaxID=568069 RepID=A0A1J1IMW1_9DIPT|nr:CLUMA_CG014840, isoform A [Clunio marinus]